MPDITKLKVNNNTYDIKDSVARTTTSTLQGDVLNIQYDITNINNDIIRLGNNIPTKTSELTNDSGYITKSVNDLDNYTLTSSLSSVATSGSYNDLSNKPTIPTKTSELTNDSGYITDTDYATTSKGGTIKITGNRATSMSNGILQSQKKSFSDYANLSDYGFISKGTLENVITGKGLIDKNVNDLTNYTLTSNLSSVATSGSYNDLSNKPTIPTKTSDLTNDSNFITPTNYATTGTGGVIRINDNFATNIDNSGRLISRIKSFSDYTNLSDYSFISKGTLENVITGKDLTTKSYVDGYVNSTSGSISTGNITVTHRTESKFYGKFLGVAEANTTTNFEITGTCGILFLYNSYGFPSCFLFNKITAGSASDTFVFTALIQPQNHSIATVDGTHISVTCGGIKLSVYCLQFN